MDSQFNPQMMNQRGMEIGKIFVEASQKIVEESQKREMISFGFIDVLTQSPIQETKWRNL